MKPNTSALVTSTGSFATIEKNTFRSYAAAHVVFGRALADTKSR